MTRKVALASLATVIILCMGAIAVQAHIPMPAVVLLLLVTSLNVWVVRGVRG